MEAGLLAIQRDLLYVSNDNFKLGPSIVDEKAKTDWVLAF